MAGRVRTAADRLRRGVHPVRFVASILMPADETVFWLFDGDEADVRAVNEHAGVAFERLVESIRIDGSESSEVEQ